MLIILPPSETKTTGGDGAPLDLATLSFPTLDGVRRELVAALIALAADTDASAAALGLGRNRDVEVARNAALADSPTLPAIRRYTGVLYDALDPASLPPGAADRLAIGSALFGLLRATDAIPAYRLSAGSRLPGRGTLRAAWKPALHRILATISADEGPLMDLRSGAYRQLGQAPGALTADVVTEHGDGSRTVVSHFNKHVKGLLARALAAAPTAPRDLEHAAAVASAAGLRVETPSATRLLVVTGPA